MRDLLIVLVAVAAMGCTSSTTNSVTTDSSLEATDTLVNGAPAPETNAGTPGGKQDMLSWDACYLHVEGRNSQDTMSMKLRMRGGAEGEYNWIPYQKDARRGTVKLTVSGDILKGTWTYMQEGMKDSLPIEFKMKGDTLYQKVYHIDKATGRQVLDDRSIFGMVFLKTDCYK